MTALEKLSEQFPIQEPDEISDLRSRLALAETIVELIKEDIEFRMVRTGNPSGCPGYPACDCEVSRIDRAIRAYECRRDCAAKSGSGKEGRE